MDDVLADILQTCLERLERGASVEDCLIAFPQYRNELEPSLRAAARVQAYTGSVLSPNAIAIIEAHLARVAQLRAASPMQTGQTAMSTSSSPFGFNPVAELANFLRVLGYSGALSPNWLRAAVAATALAMTVLLGSVTYAAARAIQNIIAPPTPVPTATVAPVFTLRGPIEQLAPDRWVVNAIPVALDDQTRVTGTPQVGAQAQVVGAFQADGTLLAQTITVEAVATVPPAPPTVPAAVVATTIPTPTPEPTATPAPTATPQPTPTPPPPGSFEALRLLLVVIVADGRAGADGEQLIVVLEQAQAAANVGDAELLRLKLIELRLLVIREINEGTIDVALGQQIIVSIDAVATTYNIVLIEQVNNGGSGGGGGGGGDDDDDDDDDD